MPHAVARAEKGASCIKVVLRMTRKSQLNNVQHGVKIHKDHGAERTMGIYQGDANMTVI